MLNNWIYLFLLCQIQWMFKGIHYNTNYCPHDSEPVVQMCLDNHVTATKVVYVNSGGAPKYQRVVDCKCLIQDSANRDFVCTLELIDATNLNADMGFTVNGDDLQRTITAGGIVNLMYSKRNDSSYGGGCVQITSDTWTDKIFSITCDPVQIKEVTSTQAKPSNDANPHNETNITLIAVITVSIVGVAVIVAVIIAIVFCKRKRKPDFTQATCLIKQEGCMMLPMLGNLIQRTKIAVRFSKCTHQKIEITTRNLI